MESHAGCCLILVFIVLQVVAAEAAHVKELSTLNAELKEVKDARQALEDKLGALEPAHEELKQEHQKTSTTLKSTQASLQKSEEARVYAEVRTHYLVNDFFLQQHISSLGLQRGRCMLFLICKTHCLVHSCSPDSQEKLCSSKSRQCQMTA